jgi:hypothetical protein
MKQVIVYVVIIMAISCSKSTLPACINYSWQDEGYIEATVCQSGILYLNKVDVGMLCRNDHGELSKVLAVASGDVLTFHYVDYPSGDYSLKVDIKVVR